MDNQNKIEILKRLKQNPSDLEGLMALDPQDREVLVRLAEKLKTTPPAFITKGVFFAV